MKHKYNINQIKIFVQKMNKFIFVLIVLKINTNKIILSIIISKDNSKYLIFIN